MPLDIISINCRGLKVNKIKRKHIFDTCRNYGISCLQETHIDHNLAPLWKREWQGELRYVPGDNNSNSKGQIILINKDFKYTQIEDVVVSDRIHGITIHTQEGIYTIINVYGPNKSKEKKSFFNDLTNTVLALDDGAEFHTT